MITKLLEMKEVAKQKINEAKSIQELNETKAEYLGKKSPIQALFGQMKDLSVEEKKELGQKINEFKGMIEEEIAKKLEAIKEEEVNKKLQSEAIDVTLPGKEIPVGNLHVLSKTIEETEEIFTSMGYEVAEGPEVEMDLYNFEMMNLPKNHPARDMQDSFYINPNNLLRTHTSPVQARTMLKAKGEAIKVLTKYLGVDYLDTYGFGNDYNDIEMFEVVCHSIVMDNANDDLKSKAKIIAHSNDNDGVAKLLSKLFLNKESED